MALLSRAVCRYARESAKLVVGSRNCVASLLLLVLFSAAGAVSPASAQNAVPPTALQTSPTGLAAPHHVSPAGGRSTGSTRPTVPSRKRGAPDVVLYENGPVNGTTDSWTINFGFIVSDSFTLSGGAIVKDFDIWVWELPGDSVSTVEWSITSQENGGMIFGSGTASVSDSFLSTNGFGYNIDQLTISGLSVPLPAGDFWLNLQNATVPSGNPVFWDENSGTGCHSVG